MKTCGARPTAKDRRWFLVTLFIVALHVPLTAAAQQARVSRIGFLPLGSPSSMYDQVLVNLKTAKAIGLTSRRTSCCARIR
jgi:hypothetical protein